MNKIKRYFYNISTKKLKNTRIILLSDIHYYNNKELFKLNNILEHVKELKPDYICIVGDMLDQAYIHDKDIIYNWLKKLGEIAKTIIGIGNHDLLVKEDFEAGFDEKLFSKINKLSGVVVLNDDKLVIDNICFMGVTLPASYFYQEHEPGENLIEHMNQTFTKVLTEHFNILLCHSPLMISNTDVLDKIKICKQLDLILCGHTHGGITPECLKPILMGRGIISPLKKFFFKNAYGHIKYNDINIVISSGVTKFGHRNRFHKLNSLLTSEITVIDIHH